MKRTIFIIMILTGAAALWGEGREDKKSLSGASSLEIESRDFAAGEELQVDLRTGGSLTITGKDTPGAEITIKKRGDAVEGAEVSVKRIARGVFITSRYYSRQGGSGGVDLIIELPKESNLSINTLGGDVVLKNLQGDFDGKTLGGDIELSGLIGFSDLETLGGEIRVSDSELNGRVYTMGGDIRVVRNRGNLATETLGGRVTIKDSAADEGVPEKTDKGEEPLEISSLGGDIEIDSAPSGIIAETLGGDIRVNHAAQFAELKTMGGDIEVNNMEGSLRAETLGGDVKAHVSSILQNEECSVNLSSLGGDVTLFLPEGLDMTVDIVLEITKRAKRDYKIISDYDLSPVTEEPTAAQKSRNIREIIRVSKVIGAGTHPVCLTTTDGNITLESHD